MEGTRRSKAANNAGQSLLRLGTRREGSIERTTYNFLIFLGEIPSIVIKTDVMIFTQNGHDKHNV
jgi:hypothetical protein